MQAVIDTMLRRIVHHKPLEVTYASGRTRRYGPDSGRPVRFRLVDREAERALAIDPALKLGELYMDGQLQLEEGDVFELISLLKTGGLRRGAMPHTVALSALRVAHAVTRRALLPEREAADVAHHYDLDERLFRLFLDEDLQYTCAYFEHPEQSLEDAQLAKKRLVTAKLMLRPEQRVLELGCGWGGLGLYMASVGGARVTACTLSGEQASVAKERARARGLSERVHFAHANYRDMDGHYDRVVSVGMLEHVGPHRYAALFEKISQVLDKHGVAVLHFITRTKPTYAQQVWEEKYIFPGAYIPALSEVLPAVERANLLVRDVEVLPLHYAETLREWRRRFVAQWDTAARLYDERFCRMWEFYLAAAEAGFRHDRLSITHLQLSRHQGTVPRMRGYLADELARLRAQEEAPLYGRVSSDAAGIASRSAGRQSD